MGHEDVPEIGRQILRMLAKITAIVLGQDKCLISLYIHITEIVKIEIYYIVIKMCIIETITEAIIPGIACPLPLYRKEFCA